jgi:hypothetical protein
MPKEFEISQICKITMTNQITSNANGQCQSDGNKFRLKNFMNYGS